MTAGEERSGDPPASVEERSATYGWARRTLYGGGGAPGRAWRAASAPLGWLWERAARRRLERPDRWARLAAPVVSVGNVTVGGGGKTSLVQWIVESGLPPEWTVAVLTRGHGRSDDGVRVLAPGGELPGLPRTDSVTLARLAGDEPTLLSRAGAWVAVGADRAAAARAVCRFVDPDLFALDDGLQHRRIARSLDLVAFSAADLHAPARCLPAGPLRQGPDWRPPDGAWVVTGADPRREGAAPGTIDAAFSSWWTSLPGTVARWVDRGTVTLESWHAVAASPRPVEPSERPVVVFAGVARPESVGAFAARAGFPVGGVHAFPDHHRYRASDAAGLLARHPGATLLTTEKDAVKLDPAWFEDRTVGVLRRALDPDDPDLLRGLVLRAAGREP